MAIFFCQRIDEYQDINRRVLEKELGRKVRLFPLPCSGRIEPLHLMRALESGADKVYVLTCPEGACRYREGNTRARKRVKFVQGLMNEIGLESERLELIHLAAGKAMTIDEIAKALLSGENIIAPSPLNSTLEENGGNKKIYKEQGL